MFVRPAQADGPSSPGESERLLRLARIVERATALCAGNHADALQWLETPIPALANQRPLDAARTEPSARG